MLRSLSSVCKSKDEINKVIFAYKCSQHSATGYSPFELMFGRKARLSIDVLLSKDNCDTNEERNYLVYVKNWKQRMKKAFQIASSNTTRRRDQGRAKQNVFAKLKQIEVGGRVLVRNLVERGGTGKLRSFWKEIVFVILDQKDENGLVYEVQEEGNLSSRKRIIHRNKLR